MDGTTPPFLALQPLHLHAQPQIEMPRNTPRKSGVDPLLDRKLVSSAEGALPVHTRVAVLLNREWQQGLITQTWSSLGQGGKAIILYKIAFDSGKEQEVDLSVRDAKLITSHVADTPRLQRKASSNNVLGAREAANAPVVGVTNIPSPSKLGSLKVPELKRYLTDLGMEAKGNKKELVAALTRAHSAAQAMLSGAEVAPVGANNNAENVEDLKATIASLREELQTERAALTDAAMEVTEKTSANEELVEELSNKSTLLTEAESTIASLRAALSKKESEGTQMSQWVVELEEREHQLQCELQELKGNIRVLCRLRPNKNGGPVAEASGLMSSGMCRSLTMQNTTNNNNGPSTKTFEFDRVFGEEAKTAEVYEELRPLAKAVADGSKATVLAYGQTGSGKTYTMEGMQALAVDQLLSRLQASGNNKSMVRLSVIEVHNEKLCDLLSDNNSDKLELRQGKDGQPFVDGASWHPVTSSADAQSYVEAAAKRRVTADNGLNERSSRSHLVMMYQVVNSINDNTNNGQLTLVDLAGSERLSRTEATGTLQTETVAINKSLSALGDVMTAIAAKDSHIPYRNSKLTFLLQPSLTRGSKVMFIIAASPDQADAPETLISLGFGQRARTATLGREISARPAPSAAAPPTPGRAMPTTPGRAAGAPNTPGALAKSPHGNANVMKSGGGGGGLMSPKITGSKRPNTPNGATPGKRMMVYT